jgi:hypothetical protein
MKSDKILLYGGLAVGAYLLWQYLQANPAGSPATAQEEAQAAASTLSANIAAATGAS